ncbi:hypothetical protein JCGZ_06700 [Jatropha curcas]|uniref:Zinc finger PHD-type domain-containing protein n=1 Tax=Jatropha curcas TaxID=180498 RepID=A0A067KS47_JATCU|nr:PHD finger protein At1g33420 [Jatropha curcas]KDP37798.1 hypothetical protein JCGZ_06700 [Jatropha curcas]
MVVNDRPLKRPRKNRVTANLYDFYTFPTGVAEEQLPSSPFRDNIKQFLSRHARVSFPPPLFPSLLMWQIVFRVGDLVDGPDLSPVVVLLDIVEEDVTRTARSAYCNHCQVVGWSGHPVCRKRYHFIIRATSSHNSDEHQKLCIKCSSLLDISESRCKWCDTVINGDDVDMEDWLYSQFEDNTHLLHGVVHSNGFGHLLRVNGREGGSNILTGSHIMDFWDRLCAMLAIRKVSVMDVSRKYGMEYRLLHAITKGCSWYGNWGYEFQRGSYALTSDSYQKAVETLSKVPLTPLLFQRRKPRTQLQAVIAFYCSLSDLELVTLKDLCFFLLKLIHESNDLLLAKATEKNLGSYASNALCAWTRNDVECVQQTMIKVVEAASGVNNWVSRHALKGVMYKRASPELLDYCLKHLGGKLAANGMVVQTRCNPDSYDAEYRLVTLSHVHHGDGSDKIQRSLEVIKRDLKFILDSLLDPKTIVNYGPQVTRESVTDAATTILDCKQFMKDYLPDKMIRSIPSAIHLFCHIELSDQPKDDPSIIPPELIVLPLNATVADLKNEATKVFQEVYAMFKKFEAHELSEYGSLEDSITLKFLLGTSGSVKIKGTCPSKHALSHFRMERGTERWTVDCPCGAKDDDGEKMLACDTCGVWQHTRCAGIDSADKVTFICIRCMNSYREKCERVPDFKEVPRVSRTLTCRSEAIGTGSVRMTHCVP